VTGDDPEAVVAEVAAGERGVELRQSRRKPDCGGADDPAVENPQNA
jgi:hypothetical protein